MAMGQTTEFLCPGESQPISRAVHLARLAAFYPKCRDCAHRCDQALLSPSVIAGWSRAPRTAGHDVELTDDGLRGRYLNDLDRAKARTWARAFAAWLWRQRPLTGVWPVAADAPPRAMSGPVVMVGYDERPSSPDLMVGVMTGLRQMGCRVLNIGPANKPIWQFAADHWNAAGGLFITGAGSPASWTGLDFCGDRGQPSSFARDWTAAELSSTISRPTRLPGSVSTCPAQEAYAASLWRHFHALRPLRVACATASPLLQRLLDQLFARLPCQLRLVTDISSGANQGHDLAIQFAEDAQACTVADERGQIVPAPVWQAWLRTTSSDPQFIARHDDDGRVWSGSDVPVCDGLRTLGLLLQALSQSDAPFSDRLDRAPSRNAEVGTRNNELRREFTPTSDFRSPTSKMQHSLARRGG